ncbi:MAG: TetR/AcrR family transcriptional regulator [Thermoproteota archaeon]|jgi:TetR/AcrR family transcriptional regulator, repressor for uid operon|nr:TetR/AcrR family transcriptional regulator [Thermoproteota archaeon]
MSPKVTQQYKLELREKIIKAAIDAFSKYGFDRTRMDDVAKTADLSKGTIYLHFKSKEDLFYAICENNLAEAKQRISTMFAKKEDLVSEIERFYDVFRKKKTANERVFFETIAESARNAELRKALYKQRMNIFETAVGWVNLQIERGFFRKNIDANAIAVGLVSLYDGLTVNKLLGVSEDYNKKAWVETIRAIIIGIS